MSVVSDVPCTVLTICNKLAHGALFGSRDQGLETRRTYSHGGKPTRSAVFPWGAVTKCRWTTNKAIFLLHPFWTERDYIQNILKRENIHLTIYMTYHHIRQEKCNLINWGLLDSIFPEFFGNKNNVLDGLIFIWLESSFQILCFSFHLYRYHK